MRRLALFLVILFPIATSVQLASAAIKPGSKCAKASTTKVSSGYKYTCVKSGKKLAWSTGVAISATPAKSELPLNGEACAEVGEKVLNSKGYLECRAVAGNKLQYMQLSKSLSAIANPNSPDSIETCHLKDQRPVRDAYDWQKFRAVTYPASPEPGFVNSGVEKIVLVGIDFEDAQGVTSPKKALDEIVQKSADWLKWYSQGKLKWNFTTHDDWVRAPKPSVVLNSAEVGADAQITDTIKSEYITAIDKVQDVSGAAAIWVIYPESATKIYAESQNRSYFNPTRIKNGSISPAMLAIGNETYLSRTSAWLYFVHETMHGQGMMGHSPQWPYAFGIMNNEYSPSNNLSGWESLVMGWGSKENLYCIDLKNVTNQELTLVPIEREQSGISTVLVKLSESKMLGIESHRVDKWSPLQFPGLYGISAYLIDLATNNRENITIPTGNYQKSQNTNHGFSPVRGTPIEGFENFGRYLIDGVGVSAGRGMDLSALTYLGESLTVEGVKISLIKSGDNDTIKLEKTS